MDKSGNVISLEDDKNLFFLLVRMQDEVHRFAITYHHQKRGKNFTKSILDDIEGLGNKRKQLILDHYTDIDSLKKATVEELSQYIPLSAMSYAPALADAVQTHPQRVQSCSNRQYGR